MCSSELHLNCFQPSRIWISVQLLEYLTYAHIKIFFCSAASTLDIKKIIFQCQVNKQHQCSIMLKEIIPTRGMQQFIKQIIFQDMCTFVSFFRYIMFFSAQFCKKDNCSTNTVSLSKVKTILMSVAGLSVPCSTLLMPGKLCGFWRFL